MLQGLSEEIGIGEAMLKEAWGNVVDGGGKETEGGRKFVAVVLLEQLRIGNKGIESEEETTMRD